MLGNLLLGLVSVFFSIAHAEQPLAPYIEENTQEYLKNGNIADELDFGTTQTPRFYTRAEWGADESLRLAKKVNNGSKWYQIEINALPKELRPEVIRRTDDNGNALFWPIMENKNIAKFVVHHTAENLQTERGRTPKEIMRAIYRYHTIGRGWGDIGYNFVIDRFGNVYEGRAGYEKNKRIPVGAHAALRNVGTVGIALMGNFQTEQPTKAQLNVLALLIADLSRQFNVDPLGHSTFHGKYLPNVVLHGQIAAYGHGTACAGRNMYKQLPNLRKKIAGFISELKSFEKNGYRTGLDFLTGPSSRSRLLNRHYKKKLKKSGRPIWVRNPDQPPLIRRNEAKTIDISVRNDSTIDWRKSLSLVPENIPDGMVISKFYLTGATPKGRNGIFRGKIYIKNTPNGKYVFRLVPKFLGKNVVDSQMKRGSFEYEVQVAGDKNSLTASVRNTSFFKNLQTNSFKTKSKNPATPRKAVAKKTTSRPLSSFFGKKILPDKPTNNFGTPVKIKIAGFSKDYEKVMGSSDVVLWKNSREKIAKFPAYTPIKIYYNKAGEKYISVKVGEKNWKFSPHDKLTFSTAGFLELLNYQNQHFGSAKLRYNKFRGKLHFKVGDDNHLMVINELPLEQYLWGLGEEPSHEPLNKKKTIFILARSYAYVYSGKRRKFNRYDYDLEDDPRTSQLYLGYDWERYHQNQKDIVKETQGQVLYSAKAGRAVIGPYFTQSAGYSINPWRSQYPWAKARQLPYDKGLQQRGHGVGLSGHSARILAEKGATVQEIIDYFFDGLKVKKIY